jgi:VWFA-related protein
MGGTALYDAAFEAVRRVAEGPADGKAVVLVTDGVDTSSTTSLAALRELARRSEVPIFSIGLAGMSRLVGLPQARGGRVPGGGGAPPPRGWPGGRGGTWPPGGIGGSSWPGGGGRPQGPPWSTGPREGFDDQALLELADETGGRAEILRDLHYSPGLARGERELKAAVESIAMTLRHRYLLGYEPPESTKGWRAIRVEVKAASATAQARKGYYAGG